MILPGIGGGVLPGIRDIIVTDLGHYTASGSNAITANVTVPAGTDVLIALSFYGDDNASDSRALSGLTWGGVALLNAVTQFDTAAGRSVKAYVYYKLAPAAGTANYVQSCSSGGDKGQSVQLLAVRGVNHLADTALGTNGASTTQAAVGIVTTKPSLVVGSCCGQYNGTANLTSTDFDNIVRPYGVSAYCSGAFWKIERGIVNKNYKMTSSVGLVNTGASSAGAAAFDYV